MSLHPLQQAQASHIFYKDLLRFVQHGLRDFTGRSFEAGMPLLAGALAEKVADSLNLLPNKPLASPATCWMKGMRWLTGNT